MKNLSFANAGRPLVRTGYPVKEDADICMSLNCSKNYIKCNPSRLWSRIELAIAESRSACEINNLNMLVYQLTPVRISN